MNGFVENFDWLLCAAEHGCREPRVFIRRDVARDLAGTRQACNLTGARPFKGATHKDTTSHIIIARRESCTAALPSKVPA